MFHLAASEECLEIDWALPLLFNLFLRKIAANTDGELEKTNSRGTVGLLGGGWKIWGWPLLTSHEFDKVFVKGDLAQQGIPLALLWGKRLTEGSTGCWKQWGAPREANRDPAFAKAFPVH